MPGVPATAGRRMRIALISDIHANLAALEAVLRDIDAQRVDAIHCLGDLVGFGPQPAETIDRVRAVCAPGKAILGDHDHRALHAPLGFNPHAQRALLWTQRQIRPSIIGRMSGTASRWDWLASLPTAFTEGDVLFTHASPRDHTYEFILEELTRGRDFLGEGPETLLAENFARVQHTCFIGHTHRPGVITGDDHAWHGVAIPGFRWVIDPRKTIINVGSVGQPRDGDPRACYVVFDGESVEWRRVAYDIETTRALIHRIPVLGDAYGDRLLQGR